MAQRNRSLTPEQFTAAVQALRVLDGSGRWWTSTCDGWLALFDGTSWVAQQPDGESGNNQGLMAQKGMDAPRLSERQQLWSRRPWPVASPAR